MQKQGFMINQSTKKKILQIWHEPLKYALPNIV